MTTLTHTVADCTTHTTSHHTSLFARFAAFIAEQRAAARHRGQLKTQRRAFLNMANLDDRMLEDIGVMRYEFEDAANLPLEINASLAVRQMAADRRAREQRLRRR